MQPHPAHAVGCVLGKREQVGHGAAPQVGM